MVRSGLFRRGVSPPLAVAAKSVMASVSDDLMIETLTRRCNGLMVAPLTVLAFGGAKRLQDESRR